LLISLSTALLTAEDAEKKSVYEERREKIAYGIDSEVAALIDTLVEEHDDRFIDELLQLFDSTLNAGLQEKIIGFFDQLDLDDAVDPVFLTLQREWDQELSRKLTSTMLQYLKTRQSPEITSFIAENLVPDRDETISIAAISAVGVSGRKEFAGLLLDGLEEDDVSSIKRAELISAVGLLGDPDAVLLLSDLLLDETEDTSIRWRSADALGEIGGQESLDALLAVFSSSDPILRSKATAALSGFEKAEVEDALIQALRDSFWRVRVAATQALGELKSEKAVDILIYKAKSDPDIRNVRLASLAALGEIASSKAVDFLYDTYLDEKALIQVRTASLHALLEADPGRSLKAVKKLFETEIGEKESAIVIETAKLLSRSESDSVEELYAQMLTLKDRRDLVIYALRGIRINKLTRLKGEVEALTGDDVDQIIRKNALSTLETLE
jgi:hypothetical protein